MIDLDYHRFILQLVWVGGDLLQSIAKLTLSIILKIKFLLIHVVLTHTWSTRTYSTHGE